MTLAIAINALDGLVLATDTRKTGRTGAKDDSDKLMPVNRDIGVLTYGLAEPGHAGMTQLIAEVDQKLWGHFTLIATEAKRIFQQSYEGWAQQAKAKQMAGSLGFILGGLFEQYFWLSLQMDGPLFFLRPISLFLIAISIVVLFYESIFAFFKRLSKGAKA